MKSITASLPCTHPPAWAVLERRLFDVMDQAVQPFLDKYTREDGSLIWRDTWYGGRDGADDFYESSYNWPLLYLLGGGDHLLSLGQRQWDAITRQLTGFGLVHREYERGYDQFHQGESYIYFYFLCLADPANAVNCERARRFAGFYLGDDPEAPNYDPALRLIRAPHNGSAGPRWGFADGDDPSYGWSPGMRVYGLPFDDVPGVRHYDDLKDPALARRMGQAMQERMGRGDVAGNLIVTSLVANAYLMAGDDACRRWVADYTDAWIERGQRNGGLLPDNVGLSGRVGETLDGRWYGGLYGWTWPHGFYNIGMAATVAGANAYLLTQDSRYLDLPRSQLDIITGLGETRRVGDLEMSLRQHWLDSMEADEGFETFVVPYRYGDRGWFDWQPLSPVYPLAIWNLSMDADDYARLERLRQAEPIDWRRVLAFRNKEDSGRERPWLRFLAGDNPSYPEEALRMGLGLVTRRLALIAADDADLTQVNIHHWQEHNPVVTEALVQLTLGAPQIIYNGGLLHCRVRYYDAERRRPGLPPDVAALVDLLEAGRTGLRLVNVSPFAARRAVIQAGGFGEHRFANVRFSIRTSDYPGSHKAYAPPALASQAESVGVHDRFLEVVLPPATEIYLDLETDRYVNPPSYRGPWG